VAAKHKPPKADLARGRFHLRVGQAGNAAKKYDEFSRPLFPFWVYMECDDLLTSEAKDGVNCARQA